MATDLEISKILAVMATAWPRYELSEQTTKVYTRLLRDLDADVLEKAALDLMSKATFFPAISEVREAAFNIMLNKLAIPSEFEAWEIVMREAKTKGTYKQPDYGNALVEKAANIIGYREICLSEDIDIIRAHFFKVYKSLVERAQEEIRTLPEVRQASIEYGRRYGLASGEIDAGVNHLVGGFEK